MHKFEGVVFREGGGAWRLTSVLAAIVLLLGMYAHSSGAQTINGQISGTVTDPSGAVIVGAAVTLTYPLTGQQRVVQTGSSGDFIFPDLVPGTYDISITQAGFQTYSQKGIAVAPTEKVALHTIPLAVGNVSTEVTVQANATHVETDSSEHSALVNSTQMTDVTVKGRNYMSYVALLPGVTTSGQADAPGWDQNDGTSFNGGNNAVLVMLNGIASADDGQGNTDTSYLAPSPDAVSEMKVQTGNNNAEYGARNGGTINVIYKTGTRDFHGELYDYERNQMFNANTFFNKESSTPYIKNHPAHYDFHNPGGTIGGPFLLPHVPFNKNRDKLFLFFSADLLRRNVPAGTSPTNLTVPTIEERLGNFSANAADPANGGNSVPKGNALGYPAFSGTPIYCPGTEPTSGAAAGYLAPAKAANITAACGANGITATPWGASAVGQVNPALALFPLPTCNSYSDLYNAGLGNGSQANSANPAGVLGMGAIPSCAAGNSSYTNNYNFQELLTYPEPRSDYVLTGQYNLSKNNIWTVDLTKDYQGELDESALLAGNGWPSQLLANYQIHSSAASTNLVSTIRPNLINEFIGGTTRALQTITPSDTNNPKELGYEGINVRNNVSLGPTVLPVVFPDQSNKKYGAGAQSLTANPFDFLPKMTFASPNLSSPVSISEDGRWPFFGTDTHYNIQDDITWVKGAHAFKAGIYWEKVSRNGPSGGSGGDWSGNINFGQSTTDPNDIGYGFANAYYGVFQSYDEESDHPNGYDRFHQEEWFVQDTWKATRRLTLDYGIRFAHDTPTYDTVEVSDYRPDEYQLSAQPGIMGPCTIGGVRMAVYPYNPASCAASATFETTQSAVGLFAPEAVSGVYPFQGMQAYSPQQAVMNTPPINIDPRFGFAWDVFGNGRTALRGGFGITNNVYGVVDTVGQLVLEPPSPTVLQSLPIPSTNKQQLVITPTVFNSTLPTMLTQQASGAGCSVVAANSSCYIGPQAVLGLPRSFKDPQTYSWNLGVQHDLGHGLLLDISYVANVNRHNYTNSGVPQDALPYGINWLNTNGTYANGSCSNGTLVYGDPTKGGCNVLPSSFFNYSLNGYTPTHGNFTLPGLLQQNLPGYSGVGILYDNLNSNYNSLQAQVSKRFGHVVTLNLTYTLAKELQWSEPTLSAPKSLWHSLYYTQSGPRNNIVANWTYNLPNSHFQNAVLKQAVNGWVYEGIFNYVTGSPGLVTVGGSYNLNGGGGYGTSTSTQTRISLVPNANVYNTHGAPPAGGSALREQYLNFAAFAPPNGGQGVCDGTPANCGFGNSGLINYYGPSWNNFDMSLFKDFHLSSNEARKLEIRFETYNTFNHTEFTTLNNSISLNAAPSGGFQSSANTTFGRFTNTQPARVMALAAKLMF